jgi:hypothetical protein
MYNPKTLVTIGAVGIVWTAFAAYAYKVHKIESAKRAQIKLDSEQELRAIDRATTIMKTKIESGEYTGVSLGKMLEDYEFYIITER